MVNKTETYILRRAREELCARESLLAPAKANFRALLTDLLPFVKPDQYWPVQGDSGAWFAFSGNGQDFDISRVRLTLPKVKRSWFGYGGSILVTEIWTDTSHRAVTDCIFSGETMKGTFALEEDWLFNRLVGAPHETPPPVLEPVQQLTCLQTVNQAMQTVLTRLNKYNHNI